MSVHLTIKLVQGGDNFPVDVDMTATVEELKEQISTRAGMPKSHIRLVCAGRIWQDTSTVGSYGPTDGAIVHCLNNPPPATVPAADQTLSAVNPMASMMGGGRAPPAAAAASGDPMAQMMAQSQQMMSQNPEMMQQLMDSPMMQQIMNNPEMLRAMMRMNPQMNELMEQRPEIARMLEDPEVLRQSMQMARNPSLMREMQRNADLSMGRLDVMPGGQAALMRAHTDVVDPLMTALSGSGEGGAASTIAEYEQQSQGAPNTQALPNAWGAPAPAPPAPAAAPAPAQAPPATNAPTQTPAANNEANPMASMLQNMMAGQTPAANGGANPMAAMMQSMMANPDMMQQRMQMAQQMFGQGAGAGTGAGGAPTPAPDAPATPAPNPFAAMMAGAPAGAGAGANPMAAFQQQMMAQMMNNPAMMQQSMQMAMAMRQQMVGQQGIAASQQGANANTNPMAQLMQQAMGGLPAANPFEAGAPAPPPAAALAADAANPVVRARFAAQLSQLSAMGFCNEQACLRALIQHQGRVDAAIDALLDSGEAMP